MVTNREKTSNLSLEDQYFREKFRLWWKSKIWKRAVISMTFPYLLVFGLFVYFAYTTNNIPTFLHLTYIIFTSDYDPTEKNVQLKLPLSYWLLFWLFIVCCLIVSLLLVRKHITSVPFDPKSPLASLIALYDGNIKEMEDFHYLVENKRAIFFYPTIAWLLHAIGFTLATIHVLHSYFVSINIILTVSLILLVEAIVSGMHYPFEVSFYFNIIVFFSITGVVVFIIFGGAYNINEMVSAAYGASNVMWPITWQLNLSAGYRNHSTTDNNLSFAKFIDRHFGTVAAMIFGIIINGTIFIGVTSGSIETGFAIGFVTLVYSGLWSIPFIFLSWGVCELSEWYFKTFGSSERVENWPAMTLYQQIYQFHFGRMLPEKDVYQRIKKLRITESVAVLQHFGYRNFEEFYIMLQRKRKSRR